MAHPVYYPVEGTTLPIFFSTYDGGTGASVTLTGLAVTDVEIYKGTSVTQRASDAGVALVDTDGIDLDSVTGIHGFSIDLSDNTDAGFYAVDSWYHVVVSSITVDAQTVNFIAAAFRIVSATRGMAGTALPAAAADAAGGLPISDAGGLDLDSIKTDTAAILVDTGTTLQAEVDAIQAAVITNAAGTDIAADIIAIKAETAAILADTGTDGVVVASIAAGAVTAAAIANGAIDAATFAADVDAEILSYLVDDATRIDASALNTASVTTIPAILDDTDLIDDATSGLAKIATDVAAVLVDTGTTLQAELDGIQSDTEDIQSRLPAALSAAGNIKADTEAINGVTLTGDGSVTPWGPA